MYNSLHKYPPENNYLYEKQFGFQAAHSTDLHIRCGIPQGSILGPLLFLMFVNDLKKSTKFLDPTMFADDTR